MAVRPEWPTLPLPRAPWVVILRGVDGGGLHGGSLPLLAFEGLGAEAGAACSKAAPGSLHRGWH